MSDYYIVIQSKEFYVSGYEVAYEAFCKARDFGDYLGFSVALCDGSTGEVLADNFGEDE